MKILNFLSLTESIENDEITLCWKVYTKYVGRITEIALYKIGVDCLEFFNEHKVNIMKMRDFEFIWIYKNKDKNLIHNIWSWDDFKINPIERYKDEKFKFMGEIRVTKEDIADYRTYLDAKKYNL